jgi:hypothetical protein
MENLIYLVVKLLLNEENFNPKLLEGIWTSTPKWMLLIVTQTLPTTKNQSENKPIPFDLK